MTYSLDNYKLLLELALSKGYNFSGFKDFPKDQGTSIYLRHDVDYSLEMALEMGKANHSLGVSGTFFVLLRSQAYNILSSWALEKMRSLLLLNQKIAFHFALPFQGTDIKSVRQKILTDFQFLQSEIPKLEPVFSWHNPGYLVGDVASLEVAGLLNVYTDQFTKETPYFSDSNMRYSHKEFKEIISQANSSLQLLFHPLNWVAGGDNMKDVFSKTWKYIIRECEHEALHNYFYQKAMPLGMPEKVLENFSQAWRNSIEM